MSLSRNFFEDFYPLFRLVEDPQSPHGSHTQKASPQQRQRQAIVDVEEEEKEYVVRAELPGVQKKDIDVHIGNDGHSLTIEGRVHRINKPPQGKLYLSNLSNCATNFGLEDTSRAAEKSQASEQPAGSEQPNETCDYRSIFARTMWFHHAVDGNNARANLADGILTLNLPKRMESGKVCSRKRENRMIYAEYLFPCACRSTVTDLSARTLLMSSIPHKRGAEYCMYPSGLHRSQLEGTRTPRPFSELLERPELRFAGVQQNTLSDLFVTCQIVADNKPLTVPHRTSFKAFKNSYTWNEWITFPLKYRDLPLHAQLTFTVWDIEGPRTSAPVGGTTFRMFGKKSTLRRGKHRLLLWAGQEADGSAESRTPSKVELKDEMGRLEKASKEIRKGRFTQIRVARQDGVSSYGGNSLGVLSFSETVVHTDVIRRPRLQSQKPEASNIPQSTTAHPTTIPSAAPTAGLAAPLMDFKAEMQIWGIVDPDIARENPVEDKHRRLVRGHRGGPLDRELKPDAKTRDELTAVINYPPTQPLSSEDKDLIWKFRFYLSRDPRALTKFLKAVTWKDASEVKQAVEILLPMWTEVGTADALELLGPSTSDSRVRSFAVKQLKRADDEFESPSSSSTKDRASGLADFLVERGAAHPVLGNRLNWYLMVEMEDKMVKKMYAKVAFEFQRQLNEVCCVWMSGAQRREVMRRQAELISILSTRAKEVRASKDARQKKIDKLKAFISDPKNGLVNMPAPLPLPLNARIMVTGMVPEKCSVLKSNLQPLKLTFKCTSESGAEAEEYSVIFKNGDDLRQDQLVIQLFTLMDRLLRKENLDLRLTPYDVLATSSTEGMIQFIPSSTIRIIIEQYSSVLGYLRAHYPDEGSVGTYGAYILANYIFILNNGARPAGYCVVTYILGVGDRHLDNLLVAPDVDFGYILGRDPKPFPPPVKVCKEMVDAMGGAQSSHYARFKNYCFTAFSILRKSANLILNLVALMVDANIPDIKHRDVHEQIQEKFRLDLTEEDAIKHFETLLNETSYFTVMFDRIHDLAQYWRS
ncbi:atypical/PIKK/PI3K protein kinase [Rhizoctonia solani AG-1 IA]|uniref:phosphatidylinositol 3-kinase n=1 Tax=Thanatephorus cucumeris (strain AG1-IA) TaxID=983506 RepID=L8WWJ6_THACA|nr:atypical/PIKK/PI3K protein kinase [Rhizoctonia solani AG-1 IA]